jgi:hypothetical protein
MDKEENESILRPACDAHSGALGGAGEGDPGRASTGPLAWITDFRSRVKARREADERECALLAKLRSVSGASTDSSDINRAYEFWRLREWMRDSASGTSAVLTPQTPT